MAKDIQQLNCVLLNISEDRVILPVSAIAEIIPITNIINVANKPAWMLGYLDWHGNSVPLVSFEAMGGIRMPSLATGEVKAAIMYTQGEDKNFPFMSILVQGEPENIKVMENDFLQNKEEIHHPAIEQKVMVRENMASIIDYEKLETTIKGIMT